ncbi:TetR/AcrR family transcriptional regulator [Flavobacterium sufflavum]|uniref:TetR/AcrR family transcriptional regulator n=1 Tax=Flavobacterium sufflavum TaxID=1921138 RepID=A0A437L133_9FLAO|nr:TetR/AcrR family transcriptional regulator [Flavobacterium sufflavum]RVT78666.1 TetR/AcrR family transcriptional regulator [Flavobacterium sufflavum]
MSAFLENLKIKVNEKLYLKDPDTSELGNKIIQHSILLIDEIGLEHFTFKKLGERISSNESSIYRYFENKHKLVMYLSAWYWGWIEYKLILATNNIQNPSEKLNKAIKVLTEKIKDDDSTKHINESILNKIIISEFNKALYTKEVDEDNKEGYFWVYQKIINQLAAIIHEANPDYPYSKSLASTIVEGSLHQHFLNDHLNTITDCNDSISVTSFYFDLVSRILKK